jgi:protein SCO1/2
MRWCRRNLLATLLALGVAPVMAQPPGIGGPFSLLDGKGETITNESFQGRFLLVFFGYTNCPDECPAVMYKIAQALALLGATPARLQAVFITIDPTRDTPDLASRYAALFSPDIMELSGTPDAIKQVIAEYHVDVGAPDAQSGAIAHSALLYLTGPDGHFIEAFPSNTSPAMLATKLGAAMAGS